MNRFLDLREKEVINIADGKRLGYVCDVAFDLEHGSIHALIVPHKFGFFNLFRKNGEYVIPWQNIKKVGDDIIIVEICLSN